MSVTPYIKHFILAIACLVTLSVCAQNTNGGFDPVAWKPPYSLPLEGWTIERFPIPIEFAPSIPYKGVEDIRFTTGWGNAKTEEYWTYAFLWYLEGKPVIDAKTIEANLHAYYTGLVGRNIEQRKITSDKLIPITSEFKEVKADNGDLKTYHGSIHMLDYMEQKPITLNCIVHVKHCPGQNHSFIFHEISPQPYEHKIWKSLNQLWIDFQCGNTDPKK